LPFGEADHLREIGMEERFALVPELKELDGSFGLTQDAVEGGAIHRAARSSEATVSRGTQRTMEIAAIGGLDHKSEGKPRNLRVP